MWQYRFELLRFFPVVWVEVARQERAICAKPARTLGADGVSKGGGGVITLPKTNQTLMPPEDMEPSAPGVLAGV
jgi:hypothetical protein